MLRAFRTAPASFQGEDVAGRAKTVQHQPEESLVLGRLGVNALCWCRIRKRWRSRTSNHANSNPTCPSLEPQPIDPRAGAVHLCLAAVWMLKRPLPSPRGISVTIVG